MTRFEFDTMINYNLFQKFKLLDNCEFDNLTIILTNWGVPRAGGGGGGGGCGGGLQFEPYTRS